MLVFKDRPYLFAVKYEEIYLKSYETMKELKQNLTVYFNFYNDERPHDSIGRMTPTEVYYDLPAKGIAA